MALRFSRVHRLLKTDEYSSVFSLRASRSNSFFQVYAKPNDLGTARLGLVIAKKITKRANRRNYMKRILREWFRLHRETLGDFDFVVRSKVTIEKKSREEALKSLSVLIDKVKRCRSSSSS